MKQIIWKWYQKLNFPKEYDEDFLYVLNAVSLSNLTTIENYNEASHTPQENLLACLYFCETLGTQYKQKGIEESILLDTLSDIVFWTKIWFSIKNEIGLGEVSWLKNHLSLKLFCLGRLQFEFFAFEKDYPAISVQKGENLVAVHIPTNGQLSFEECTHSFELAKGFFEKYFPNFRYRFYSCYSWLLDDGLKEILGENANICRFGARFQELERHESDAILKYVFRWDTTRENLSYIQPETKLAKALKIAVEKGQRFYEVLGVISK